MTKFYASIAGCGLASDGIRIIIFCSKPSHHFSCGQSLLHGSRVVIHIAVGPSSPPIMPYDSALFFTAQHPDSATIAAHPSTTISFFIFSLLSLRPLRPLRPLRLNLIELVIGIGNIASSSCRQKNSTLSNWRKRDITLFYPYQRSDRGRLASRRTRARLRGNRQGIPRSCRSRRTSSADSRGGRSASTPRIQATAPTRPT